jgi:hypothetical protein
MMKVDERSSTLTTRVVLPFPLPPYRQHLSGINGAFIDKVQED